MVAPVGDEGRRTRLVSAAATLGLVLDEAALGRLMAYLQLLQRWNQVYNLTALRDPDDMLSHHLVDCLAIVPALQRQLGAEQPLRVLDVGSGGGLPGVVLAVLHPRWHVSCVDTVVKKVSFIRQAAVELRLPNLAGLHSRVETLVPGAHAVGHFGLITSRAFASLADFTHLSGHLLAPTGVWAAMKGKPTPEELVGLPQDVAVFHVEQLQVPGLDAQRCLVWMRPQTAT